MGRSHTFTGRVPKLTRFLFPFAGIFRDACYALVGSFLLTYAMTTGVLSTNPETYQTQYGIITIAMMVALVWDGINDPIMGYLIEKFHFNVGKFKPWILIGAIGNTICVILMFCLRFEGLNDGWTFVICMIIFYFLWDMFFTMNDVGYWSMLPALASDDEERNSLTSKVNLCAAIGQVVMTASCFLLPSMFATTGGAGAGTVYMIIAITASVLFLLSQLAIFFFCKEKERDPEQEKISEQTHFLDLFKVVGRNKQLLCCVIAILLYTIGSGVLTGGIGLYYFYIVYGYGSWQGGLAATVISLIYIVGTVGSQALFPILMKKLTRKKILGIFSVVAIVGYVGFLLCCVPLFGENPLAYNDPTAYATSGTFIDEMGAGLQWAFGGTMWLNYIFPFVFFFAQGIIYTLILVMFQDAIDYQEWKYGEKKESVSFAWRPLCVKVGSAVLRGMQYLIFAIAGVSAYFTAVSNAEGSYNSKAINSASRNGIIYLSWQSITTEQMVIYGCITMGTIIVCMLAIWIIIHFCYKIDEPMKKQILADLEERHAKNMQAEDSTTTEKAIETTEYSSVIQEVAAPEEEVAFVEEEIAEESDPLATKVLRIRR